MLSSIRTFILSLATLLAATTVSAQAYPFAGSWHGVGALNSVPSSVDLIMGNNGRYGERVVFGESMIATFGRYVTTSQLFLGVLKNVIILQPIVWDPALGTPSVPVYLFEFTSNDTLLLESLDLSTVIRFKRKT